MLKKLLGKIFRFNQEMQAKIEWQQTDEPILFSWTHRGKMGNKQDMLLGKLGFASVIFFCVVIVIFILINTKTWLEAISIICAMAFMASPIIVMFYFYCIAGKVYTYRITKDTIELASWHDWLPKFKEMMQIFLCIIFLFLVFVFITEPAILFVSLGGMVGVGIVAGGTVYSKGYLETHLEYRHIITRWDSLQAIEIDYRGNPIILIWGTNFYDKWKKKRVALFNLFCTPEIFDEILKLIQQQVKEEELEKGIHYCETWG